MKLLALTALLTYATALIDSGEDCKDNRTKCSAGLCCGEAVYEEDVVDGEVSKNY